MWLHTTPNKDADNTKVEKKKHSLHISNVKLLTPYIQMGGREIVTIQTTSDLFSASLAPPTAPEF